MTMECYIRNCKYHGDPNEGPFCDEPFCRNTFEIVKIWPDDSYCEDGEEVQGKSDDYIKACVNEDGTIPTYDQAIRR
jgi:hypothetical protein